jgi:hypothetical protein
MFNVKIQHDGMKNAVLQVSGSIDKDITEARPILKLNELSGSPKTLRIESLVFALQEKMGIILWWKDEEGMTPILPVEGKGGLDFSVMQGIHGPKTLEGIYITTFGVDKLKYMLLTLDLTKQ